MTLDEARQAGPEARVIYNPRRADARPEAGVITAVGNHYVFVRYSGQPVDAPGKATGPEFLTLVPAPARQESAL